MLKVLISSVRAHFSDLLQKEFGETLSAFPVETPPKPEFGDMALSFCMGLGRKLKKAPRQIAQDLLEKSGPIAGVREMKVEGPGYINIFVDRAALLRRLFKDDRETVPTGRKIIVEHTNINPNKAAHIGHLRNAILGDTLVRTLRYMGEEVEVQNYIDDTGVQVADVVVGFEHIRKMSVDQVQALIENERFDYYCWDLYAKVGRWYEEDKERLSIRQDTLLKIENSEEPAASIGRMVANAIVRCHLRTADRIGARYDLLPRESSILHLHFWKTAFEQLKEHGAVYLQEQGKNKGCWVMRTEDKTGSDKEEDNEKVIVRSNGAVTYVGKDIAYQLWKVGKLGLDFQYREFPGFAYNDGTIVWESCTKSGTGNPPSFGSGEVVYNVIDARQAYLQRIVSQGLRALGYEQQAKNSVHFAYEMVGISPGCAKKYAKELGFELTEADLEKSHVDMSGRKGIGVKADDLINTLINAAMKEVNDRNPDMNETARADISRIIAVGALRYYLLKFGENKLIAFDIDDALKFEGETGLYLQNAVVRAKSILRKMDERGLPYDADLSAYTATADIAADMTVEQWDLVVHLLRIPLVVEDAARGLSLAAMAKYAFTVAQKFHSFYHHNPILKEDNENLRRIRLMIILLFIREMTSLFDLMGIAIPERL